MTGDTSVLTPSQEHYLKKYLIGALINSELDLLQKNPYATLPNLGGPFDLKDEHAQSTTPFLRYLFESVVVPFPFLAGSKGELWPKLQAFVEEWAKIESGNGIERDEMVRRRRMKAKAERTMVMMYSMAVKTVEQREQEKKDLASPGDHATTLEDSFGQFHLQQPAPAELPSVSGPSTVIYGARINVAGVKSVWIRRHIREHEHAEFLVSSKLPDGRESIVARRHGQFRRLYASLREEYPRYEFPLPPAKSEVKSGSAGAKAAHEKDRISLRGYLHNLARVAPEIVTSTIFVQFLTKDPVTLTADELKDIQIRAALDQHRAEQQEKFDREVAAKVQELEGHMKQVKLDLLQPGGVSRLFDAFRQYENVQDLPPLYQTVFEWGCMNFASTLYHAFTASDDAALNFTQLKRTNMLMPYRTMWGILKVSNPMAMMKGMMDLFLAQPFGSRSLMQRIISVNLQEEITEYKKDIVVLETSINDPALCDKIRNYVYASKEVVSQIIPEDRPYDITQLGLVMDVLKSDAIQPTLNPAQIKRVFDAQQQLEKDLLEKLARHQSMDVDLSDSDSDSETSSIASTEEGSTRRFHSSSASSKKKAARAKQLNLIRQLQQLLVTHLRIRDKERMMGLVFQGVTGEIFKELISIFYQPLVQVYKSANVADSLMDVKDFVDELIKIVEQVDVNDDGRSGKPSTASLYLNLVRKHLPSFYRFVHSVHKQDDGLFHDLLEWIESILTFLRTGYARTRINYKTEEELRVSVDLKSFVRNNVDQSQWAELEQETVALQTYFGQIKERKREEVREMARISSSSSSVSSATPSVEKITVERDHDRIAKELKGMGLQQEDVDELEMINYSDDDDDDEAEKALKMPKVPVIDTLKGPFVLLMDKAVFQLARE
ncbi:hypothetical protein EMPS_09468 [Entomortierella parvispora]|uniref:PX domain-containing protein n=1 Tax=Entomortierella parvispora TaxID=205924 RepID=A0A9P3M0A7_9FUNG|nr:hypothetical protein EMPS_09468 [Entomortierella parvispora]